MIDNNNQKYNFNYKLDSKKFWLKKLGLREQKNIYLI